MAANACKPYVGAGFELTGEYNIQSRYSLSHRYRRAGRTFDRDEVPVVSEPGRGTMTMLLFGGRDGAIPVSQDPP
jgi:hypothetical protein